MDGGEAPPAPPDRKCMYYCRVLMALLATVLLLIGIAMQVVPPRLSLCARRCGAAAGHPPPHRVHWRGASRAAVSRCWLAQLRRGRLLA
jgi:hypothetical protein